jgi:Fe2+ or Zn2+ uptake regulation protein
MGVKSILTCDTCGATKEFDKPYHVAKAAGEMKAAGWRNVKVGEEWKIRCPGCAGK